MMMEETNNEQRQRKLLARLLQLIVKWFFLTAAVSLAAHWLDGIHISDFYSALAAAGVLGLLNVFVRPVLIIFTLPINILSIGLFTFIINAMMLKLASFIAPGFSVDGFMPALIGALFISIINWALNLFLDGGNIVFIRGGRWR